MKKHFEKLGKMKERTLQYWEKVMHSRIQTLSRGASNVYRMMPWARGDSWRRKDEKKSINRISLR